jgi:diadenosine tetraphosphate (Ap4A) HIT family hydrolase
MAEGYAAVTDPLCKACSGQWPRADHFIADMGLSMAYLHDDQFFPGWMVVVFKRHATELFHLAPTERIQLMEEVNRAAKTLAKVFEAKKINYELLGNQLPHIHWHVIPRLAADQAPLEPVWRVPHEESPLSPTALQETIRQIQVELNRETAGH